MTERLKEIEELLKGENLSLSERCDLEDEALAIKEQSGEIVRACVIGEPCQNCGS